MFHQNPAFVEVPLDKAVVVALVEVLPEATVASVAALRELILAAFVDTLPEEIAVFLDEVLPHELMAAFVDELHEEIATFVDGALPELVAPASVEMHPEEIAVFVEVLPGATVVEFVQALPEVIMVVAKAPFLHGNQGPEAIVAAAKAPFLQGDQGSEVIMTAAKGNRRNETHLRQDHTVHW